MPNKERLLRPKMIGLWFAESELAELDELAKAAGLRRGPLILRRLALEATKRIEDARAAGRQAVAEIANGAGPIRPKGKGGRPRKAA